VAVVGGGAAAIAIASSGGHKKKKSPPPSTPAASPPPSGTPPAGGETPFGGETPPATPPPTTDASSGKGGSGGSGGSGDQAPAPKPAPAEPPPPPGPTATTPAGTTAPAGTGTAAPAGTGTTAPGGTAAPAGATPSTKGPAGGPLPEEGGAPIDRADGKAPETSTPPGGGASPAGAAPSGTTPGATAPGGGKPPGGGEDMQDDTSGPISDETGTGAPSPEGGKGGAGGAGGPGGGGGGEGPGGAGPGKTPGGGKAPGDPASELDPKQRDAVAGALKDAGVPDGKLGQVIADSIRNGKIDPSQLLAAAQNAAKPFNAKALVDGLRKAAEKLPAPLDGELRRLADRIAALTGLSGDKKAQDRARAELERELRQVAEAVRNAIRNAQRRKKDDKKDKKDEKGDENTRGKATCKIFKNGRPLEIDQSKIVTCIVNQAVDLVDSFAITFTDNDLKLSSDATFAEGEKIAIELGWQGGAKGIVIHGQVTGRELDFPRRGPVLLTVHGLSLEHKLNRGRFTRAFCKAAGDLQTKDSDVATQIAQECGLEAATVDDTQVKFEYIFQNNMTNLEFLRQRAALYNYEVEVTEENKFHFRKPAIKKAPPAKLKRGKNLKHFRASMDLTSQVAEVQVRGWNPKDKKEITGSATKADIQDRMDLQRIGPEVLADFVGKAKLPQVGPTGTVSVVVSQPVISQDEATAIAKSVLNYYAYGFVQGDGSTWGDPSLKAGGMVELQAVGKRFEGLYYLRTVSHVFENQGYTTMFEVYRPGITPNEVEPPKPPQPTPPPTPPPPVKTFFEFLAEGLKQIPLAQAQARSRRTTAPGYEKEYQDTPLDGQGMIKKPSVDPGLYNVQIAEVVGGSWALGDELPPEVKTDSDEKAPIEDLKLDYAGPGGGAGPGQAPGQTGQSGPDVCDPCKQERARLQQEIDRKKAARDEKAKAAQDARAKVEEARRRTLPKIDDMWRQVSSLGGRAWDFAHAVLDVGSDFLSGVFRIHDDHRHRVEEGLKAVQAGTSSIEGSLRQIEDFKKNCPHLGPTLDGAKRELEGIRNTLQAMNFSNLVQKGQELAQKIQGASNVKRLVDLGGQKPCEECVKKAEDEAKKAEDDLTRADGELQQLERDLASKPTPCPHAGGGGGGGTGPGQSGAGQSGAGQAGK
jgi:phage protein D